MCYSSFNAELLVISEEQLLCNEGTLLLCISVYAVSVDVLMHAVDLHKTASH